MGKTQNNKADQRSTRDKDRLRLTPGTNPTPAISALPDGSVDFINQRWLEYLGLSLEDVRGWGWTVAIHPEDVERFVTEWRAAIATGESIEKVARFRRSDGEYRRFLLRIDPLRDEQGRIIRWHGTRIDIEDRTQAEENFKALLESAPDAMVIINEEGKILIVNSQTEKLFGYGREELYGQTVEMLIPGRFRGRHLGHRTEYIRKPKTRAMGAGLELYGLRKGGSEFPIDISLSPLNTEEGVLVTAAIRDITERKKAEEALRRSEDRFRSVIDAIPGLVWSAKVDGFIDFLNQRWIDYTGFTLEQIKGWAWTSPDLIHPEDLPSLIDKWRDVLASGQPGEAEARLRRSDGEYRWFLFRAVPLHDERGNIVKWYGTNTDIEDRKRAETLLAGENRLLEMIAKGKSLASILDALCRVVEEMSGGSLASILLLDPDGNRLWHGAAPSLPASYTEAIDGSTIGPSAGSCGTAAYRREPVIVSDINTDPLWADYRDLASTHGLRACWSTPIFSSERRVLGTFAIYSREPSTPTPQQYIIIEQITHLAAVAIERKRGEEELRRSEAYLAEAQRLSLTGSFGWKVSSGELFWSKETFCMLGYDQGTKPTLELVFQRVHPEDLAFVQQTVDRASHDGTDVDFEHRLLMPDGSVKHVHVVAHAVRDESGELEFVGAVSKVTAAKKSEERIRQNEREFRQIVEAIPEHIVVLEPDGSALYANERVLEYTGLTLEDVQAGNFREHAFHPEDVKRLRDERRQALSRGVPFELEQRARRKDGQYRWFLTRFNPVRDELGHVVRWYVTGTDIDDRKQDEERTRNENIALREEVDKASMFEEIVGASPVLQAVLARVAKVAPTDSTVLITGETGTGKELIARAIHKRSPRSSRAFVSVNCAAIPPSLLASELFGHEKGAFTGALQRRLGRFELAEGGTIFLDEIGELPAETQIALLRVLQEHEFERVGGNQAIRANVRVIAATNRDLKVAIEVGDFRSDLFYRLNVFPVEVPPLRARQEDIPLLVEYFVDRYASKGGKKIRGIDKKTLTLLQSYPWPGNIRELQNVIERSVILSETENFSVDESWLSRETPPISIPSQQLSKTLITQEKEIIEAALTESRGRVSGPSGAAAKLGIPASTLESKIRSFKINKHRFKPA
ncbi:MAG: PAS domain S-box protein [Acidobacteria bacterium]|nr:PAS domain S-box protein [Acidobacteriota bacterium]